MTPIDSAERFVWCHARLVDRLRFEHLFRGGDPDRVVAALLPYRNPDGGFGGALEPDFRGPVSQGPTGLVALQVLAEVDRPVPDVVGPLCDWFATVTTDEGGVPMVLDSAEPYPKAPWWQPTEVASLLPTAGIAGFLHRHRIDHPWLGPATEYCWRALDAVPDRIAAGDWLVQVAYDVRAAVPFLDAVPDRARAESVAARLGPALIGGGAVTLDPAPTGEVATPLDFAAEPGSLGRRWFDDRTIEAHLDALLAAQREDGGWTVPWEIWTPVTEHEWRGALTVERLKTLRAYGRV